MPAPRIPAGDRKAPTHVTFVATDELRDLFDRAAKSAGCSGRTQWMIRILTAAAQKQLRQKLP